MTALDIAYDVSTHDLTPEQSKIHDKMIQIIQEHRPRRILEIGAGAGRLGQRIKELGIDYIGIEPEEAQFKIARQTYPNLKVLQASCYDDLAPSLIGQVDMVISNDVIEHLYLPRKLVDFAKRFISPGGLMVTATPDFGSYFKNVAYSLFNKWDLVHSPLWDGGHIKFFSKKSLTTLFEQEGFVDFQWQYVRNINYPVFRMSVVCICKANSRVGNSDVPMASSAQAA